LNGSIPNPDMEYCNTHTINVFQESIAARFNIQ